MNKYLSLLEKDYLLDILKAADIEPMPNRASASGEFIGVL